MGGLSEAVAGAAAGLVLAVVLAGCLWVGVHASDWVKVAAAVGMLIVFVLVVAWAGRGYTD